MSILKRPEVIVLLLVVLAIGAWALLHDPGESAPPAISSPSGDHPNEGAPALLGSSLERDYGNALLTLQVRLENSSASPQLLAPPLVRLVASDGSEVPPFTLASSRPPTVEPGRTETVDLVYWLERSHLAGALWLHVDKKVIPVKEEDGFDLESLANTESRDFKSTRWAK